LADVSAAAAALGIPEALVERSVEARAAASGTSVDDLLAAWSGGEAAPPPNDEGATGSDEIAPDDGTEETAEPDAAAEPAPEREEATPPEIVVDVPGEPAPAPTAAPAGPYKPPVLVGAKDNPAMVFAGAIFLFLIIVMVGLVGPSIPFDEPGARTSAIDFSASALDGQEIYLSVGCASCHTQMVRPIIADVGLGPVTLDDANVVLGTRRFGPDLADVGSRLTGSQIEATIGGLGAHPAQSLAADDLESLVAYLVESATSQPEGGS
jgi:hypothetical protein